MIEIRYIWLDIDYRAAIKNVDATDIQTIAFYAVESDDGHTQRVRPERRARRKYTMLDRIEVGFDKKLAAGGTVKFEENVNMAETFDVFETGGIFIENPYAGGFLLCYFTLCCYVGLLFKFGFNQCD